jgi:2,5-furandicarboxylate decarboxylase 1
MRDLRSFLAEQDNVGRVLRIHEELDPVGEAGRVLLCHQGRIVVLERLRGYSTPVLGGLVSSRELMAAAIGCEPRDTAEVLGRAMDAPQALTWVRDAPFLQGRAKTTRVDALVPMLTFQPGAERPYTSSSIVAAHSERYGMNLSFHRMMYLGENRFAVRIVPRHLRLILDEGGGMAEVAVLVGVHPAICLAASTSAGPEFNELEMASALLGGLEVVELDGLSIPAGTELVLRGRITQELAEEGPFVDLTGTLDGVRKQPVFTVEAIYRRDGFLYPTIVPGGAEHRLLMGCPQEPRIRRAVANAVPGLVSVALTSGGCNWLHAVVSLHRPRPGQAKNAGLAALGAHPSLKRVVVVDDDIDPRSAEEVEWAIATRVRPDHDIVIMPGCRGSSLDPARSSEDDTIAKWLIDATIPPGGRREDFLRADALARRGE